MKYLLPTFLLLFISLVSFSQSRTMKSQLLTTTGSKYILKIGVAAMVIDTRTGRPERILLNVIAESDQSILSEDVMNLYVSRILDNYLSNGMSVLGMTLRSYKYLLPDSDPNKPQMKINVKPNHIEVKMINSGRDYPVEPQNPHNIYFEN